jgi:RNA polymerase sigma-70 factor (ECF subfamily)
VINGEQSYIEHAILSGVSQGDRAAFQRLFEHYYPTVCHFANSIILDMQEAEDLTQELFCRLWDKRTTLSSIGNFQSFLYTAARNACLNHLKKSKRISARQQEMLYLAENDDSFLESRIVKEELLLLIMQEIEALSPKYRSLVTMIFIEGLNYNEIAERLSIPLATIRKQKERAIQQLQTALLKRHLMSIGSLTYILLYLKAK